MKYIVYLTTNKLSEINGIKRIYIGVHLTNDPGIFDGYIGCGIYIHQPSTYKYPKTPFQYAVKKYGPGAFERTILYIFNTKEEAYKKEAEIVNADFIKQSHVYNVALGGEFIINQGKPIYLFDLLGKFLKKWNSGPEIWDFYSCSKVLLDYAIQNKHLFLDSYWSISDTIDISLYQYNKNLKVTYLYNKNGKLIKEFPTRASCARFIGVDDVTSAISRNSLVQNKYYVSDKLVDVYIPKPRNSYKDKTFYIYKESGEFIKKCIGKEAMSVINMHSWEKFRDIFRSNKGWYKDFYLSFIEISEVPERKKGNGIKIDVFTKFGEFIETLDSVKEVKEKYKVPANKIKNIQKGDRYFKDFIFKYHTRKIVEDIV